MGGPVVATIVCIPPFEDVLSDLGITFPGVGRLQFLKDSIDKIPRPSEYILKMLNSAAPALSPVFTMLRIIQVVQAVLNCIKAIKKAVTQLNPGPIIKCFRGLFEAFANILPMIPPLAYVKLVVDIMTALRLLVADMLNVLVIIDRRITELKALAQRGYDNDDPNLIAFANCGKDDLNAEAATLIELLRAISLIISSFFSIMEIIADLMPGPAADSIGEITKKITGAQSDVASIGVFDFPPVKQIQTILMGLHDLCYAIETIGNTALGKVTQAASFTASDLQALAN